MHVAPKRESQGSRMEEQGNAGEGKRSPDPAPAPVLERQQKETGTIPEPGPWDVLRYLSLHFLSAHFAAVGERHRGCTELNTNFHILRFDNLKTQG